MRVGLTEFSQDYLNDIKEIIFPRIDCKYRYGNGDGKITVDEVYKDLNIDGLFDALEKDGKEYNRLKTFTDKIPEALVEYSGDDAIFSVEEYTALKNDETYSTFLKENCVSPLYKKEEIEEKPVNTKQSLKQTFKTIMKNMVEKFTSLFK